MPTAQLEDVKAALRDNFPFYAAECLKIVDKRGQLIPFNPKPPQLEFDRQLEEQRLSGRPQRGLILKARKIGFSTYCQGKAIQRATQRPNHSALTVAQDTATGGELFDMGEIMYVNLPDDEDLGIKPALRNRRHRRALYFGESASLARLKGNIGLNSSYTVDTAKEVEAGRGFTYRTIHASEVAFWPDPGKLISLLNAMPDDEDTLAIQESTANGFNHFKRDWDRAINGESDWIPHFEPWMNEPAYALDFAHESERLDFIDSIGTGAYGEDEPGLMELGASPEQLHWRRWVIENKVRGDIRIFKQEYPATDGEAFLSSGETVFSPLLIERVLRDTEHHDPERPSPDNPGPVYGKLGAARRVLVPTPYGRQEIPQGPLWAPASRVQERYDGWWRIWEHPRGESRDEEGKRIRAAQYVVAMDPAGGETPEPGQSARHAIIVIDHETKVQVAEYVSREDADLAGEQAYLAALYYNMAWWAVEITGGYGLSIARRATRVYKYPRFYRRKTADSPLDHELKRMGWSTDSATKPMLEDLGRLLLREGSHGIRSLEIPREMQTFVKDERGRSGPEDGNYADRLMAWLIAQQVAQEKPLLPDREPGQVTSTWTGRIRSTKTGY